MLELRPKQNECLDAIRNEYLAGCYQQLVVAATGTGKAVIIANIRRHMLDLLPGKMLVFAHRDELIDQLIATLEAWNPDWKVGKEMAEEHADVDCDIVVSCNASIGREGAKRLEKFGEFDYVICDEAHRSIAMTYMNVFEQTSVLKPESTRLLVGFTATPKRKNLTRNQKKQVTVLDDEELLSLKSVYRKIVFSYPIRKAIKEGWLVPLRGFRLKTKVDLSNIKTTAGDYQQDELEHEVNTPERNYAIVNAWRKDCESRQTVVFCVLIKHAQDMAEAFQSMGVKAEAIWGTDPERGDFAKCNTCGRYVMPEKANTPCSGTKKEPCSGGTFIFGRGKLERHKAKDITILCNAQLLVEGYDDWRVSCVVDAAPTRSPSVYTQRIGRGTRLQKDTGNLIEALSKGLFLEKKDCIVLDVVDNNKRCSLVSLPSLVGLNPEMDLHGKSVTDVATKMEELQEKYPTLDLSHLTDISKVDAYIESLDLFAAPYTEDVVQFTKLSWMGCSDGAYVLQIPEKKELREAKAFAQFKHERLQITPNELDEFELSISSASLESKKLGVYNTLKEAFESADDVMHRCRPDRMKLVTREAEWHSQPASEPAKKLLRSLSKAKPVLKCLCPGYQAAKLCPVCKLNTGITAGEASVAINILKARKGK
jgi:superfamily II DNA or RNA helicase